MRYRFIDRVLAFDAKSPASMTITKAFPAGDDCFTGPFPDVVPLSLLIETLAMAGGHLILRGLARDRRPLLLKVEEAIIIGAVRPGDTVVATATLRGKGGSGKEPVMAQIDGEISAAGRSVLQCRLLYVCVRTPGVDLPEPLVS
jgi:hypothetical protein